MKIPTNALNVQNISINVFHYENGEEYISITDIASFKNPNEPKDVVKNWLRNRSTIEFLGLWEKINNPDFKGVEFDSLLKDSGSNSFTLSPSKWIYTTNAIGIVSKQGRGGGTYAQKDIAFEFASWISSEFKLYLIKEYQRLKSEENERLQLNWNLNRTLSKINYRIHTNAIKENIIPENVTKEQINFIYANEADLLNVALFGKTAKQWWDENLGLDGNIRDYATIEQLLVLANIESLNAEFIKMGMEQKERLIKLNQTAISQLKAITLNINIKKLKPSQQ